MYFYFISLDACSMNLQAFLRKKNHSLKTFLPTSNPSRFHKGFMWCIFRNGTKNSFYVYAKRV